MYKNFANLNNVEIFRAGTWNGDTYSIKDLDEMIQNFNKLRPEQSCPVKLGHSENQKFLKQEGLPASGWIASLKRSGDKVLASITDVPQKIYDLIKNGAYRKISAEIYPKFKDSVGNQYQNVLRAIALLGEDIPAVSGLKDIQALYSDGQEYKAYILNYHNFVGFEYPLKIYSSKLQENFDTKAFEVRKKFDCSKEDAVIKVLSS